MVFWTASFIISVATNVRAILWLLREDILIAAKKQTRKPLIQEREGIPMSAKKRKTQNKEEQLSQTTDDLNEKIQKKAYELFERRGCCDGKDCDDWYKAEKLVESEK